VEMKDGLTKTETGNNSSHMLRRCMYMEQVEK